MARLRPATTYRAARRNAFAHAPFEWTSFAYFAGSRKTHAHRGEPRYVPYEIKPQRFQFVQSHWERRKPRKQPKIYRSRVIDPMAGAMRAIQGVL